MAITFQNLQTRDENRILVVDALNLGFRWKHQNRTDFSEDYIKTVNSFATSYKCGTVIITCDKGSSRYRKDIYPEYKMDRKERYEKQTDQEKQAFVQFYDEMHYTLRCLEETCIVLQYDGVEADDIAAYLSANLIADQVWLISSDRDWDLLIKDNVSRFSYVNRTETTLENWRDTHEFSIEDYITVKCLTGDSGDNIPGIPGIGPKRAATLVSDYGTLFDIYNACPINSKYKYIQSLNEHKEVLLRNFEIMDLLAYTNEAIGKENILDMQEKCGSILQG